jgi:hypothetical protein
MNIKLTEETWELKPSLVDRFWSKVHKGAPDECWLWQDKPGGVGYGTLSCRRNGKSINVYAHRIAYEIAHGPIPSGAVIRHTCDTRLCCNAAHLIAGTHQQNVDDREERGRGRHNILSLRQREEIRRLWRDGKKTQPELAKMFGVDPSNVYGICHSSSKRGASQYRGVSFCKQQQKWEAFISANNKKIHLGRFESERDAALAYNQAAIKHRGELADLNEIPQEAQS